MRYRFNQFANVIGVLMIASIIVACGGNTGISSTSLRGQVVIDTPRSSHIIYSETLIIRGTASDLTENRFQLELRQADDEIFTVTPVTIGDDGSWQVEIAHGYTGEPAEFALIARPDVETVDRIYVAQPITIGDLKYRPEGIYGSITSPIETMSIGGDAILVSGRISGIAIDLVEARLLLPDKLPIVAAINADQFSLLDDVLWDAELSLLEITASTINSETEGTLELSYLQNGVRIILDTVVVRIGEAAG